MLAPPLETSWQTTHRFRMSRLDSARGRRKLSLGAPRIHGELLKLGIVVSERTVSRYLPDRRPAPSQTWRTFLANHLGQFTFISPETSLYAQGDDDVVDGSGLTFRQTPLSRDAPYASHQCAVVERRSLQGTLPGKHLVQAHLHGGITIRTRSGRGPPTHGRFGRPTCMHGEAIGARAPDLCDERRCQTIDRGRRLAIVVNAVGRRTIFVRARCPPRGCFTAIGILARHVAQRHAIHDAAVHAEAHDASRPLVHHDEHPVCVEDG
jgi:hypothetical protein